MEDSEKVAIIEHAFWLWMIEERFDKAVCEITGWQPEWSD